MTTDAMRAPALCLLTIFGAACEEAQYANTPPQPKEIQRTRPGTPVELATPKERDSVSKEIANAVCDRAERCGKIGDGEKYASRTACEKQATQTYRDELDMYDCPGSIVRNAVKNCADEIREEGCLNPIASLSRMVDCDSNHLCQRPHP